MLPNTLPSYTEQPVFGIYPRANGSQLTSEEQKPPPLHQLFPLPKSNVNFQQNLNLCAKTGQWYKLSEA